MLTLASTLSTAILSVTFAEISIVEETLYILAFTGRTSKTKGDVPSLPTKKVIIVLLMLLLESLAKNVTLYSPVRFGIIKLLLYLAPTRLDNANSCVEPLGKDTFASTLSTAILSVTFAAISIIVLTLYIVPLVGKTSNTEGLDRSATMK